MTTTLSHLPAAPAAPAAVPTAAPAIAPTAAADTATAPLACAVQVTDVRKAYGERHVLRGISLTIGRGEVFGILGPNGAGKTTLVESIVGLRRPDSGQISVLGMNPAHDRHEFTTRVSVQPQDATLFESIRVDEALALFASMYPGARTPDEVIAQIGLEDSRRQLVRKLSGGQRRRLLLGVAMIGTPDLIVLDEPSAGLDPQARRGLWSVIEGLRDSGTTVLLTTHHMDEASHLCDRVAFVVAGEVRALGTPEELVNALATDQSVAFDLETTDTPLEAVLETLREHPAVRDATAVPTARGHRITVATTQTDPVLTLVASQTHWHARAISVDHGDLENVFLTVAGNGSADTPQERR